MSDPGKGFGCRPDALSARLRRAETRGTRFTRSSTASKSVGSMGPADHARRSPGLSKPARSISSAISRWPLLAECGHAFGEVRACPHAIPEHLFEGLAARGVVGDAGADLRLYCLDGGRAV